MCNSSFAFNGSYDRIQDVASYLISYRLSALFKGRLRIFHNDEWGAFQPRFTA